MFACLFASGCFCLPFLTLDVLIQGPVHFAAIDTDAWGFDEVAYVLQDQFDWLKADLASVDRSKTPWVVLLGHRE